MDILYHIFTSFKAIRFFVYAQASSELAQRTLRKWGEPTTALTHLLKRRKQTLLTLEAACIIWGKIVTDNTDEHIQILKDLLQRLPVEARDDALRLAADEDITSIASLLIKLAPFHLEGFSSLASTIKQEWDQQKCNDDLALDFYEAVIAYGVPPYEAAESQVRVLLAKASYDRAETVLSGLLAENPTPPADLYWSFLDLEQQVKRTPEQQISALQHFIEHYSADQRVGPAWQKIGDLYGSVLLDDRQTLDAYFKAEQCGLVIPQLQAYRAGNWDAIPALHHHPDCAFPPIVVVDLEVDPQPDAPKGSRVFEVAAVRYKGTTCLEHYGSYIKRSFSPSKWKRGTARLSNAPTVEIVAHELRQFIGNSIVVGHNLRAFDAPQLEGMGVPITKEQVIDTLTLALLLHPDSLHHHLALLCQKYHVSVDQTALHSALPDAHACAQLFHAMGDSLLQRDTKLLTGIRALVIPDSAFDRAILQPRTIPADPTLIWELDPAPMLPQSTTVMRGNQASIAMQTALQSKGDFFVEHADFDGRYSQSLSSHERSLLTVSSRIRIERILAGHAQPQHIFVLPHPQTLLCPTRLRKAIEASTDNEQQLALFCLYQASHNHDAATLYPLCLPSEALDDSALLSLKQALLEACCASEPGHPEDCSAKQAVQCALASHQILLTTHKNLLARQVSVPDADTVVIDDITDLQMHLAEYSACILNSRQVKTWLCSPEEQRALTELETKILEWAKAYVLKPGYRERLPLSSFLAYLEQKSTSSYHLFLEPLSKVSQQGIQVANILQKYLMGATQKPTSPEHLHAYWIDLLVCCRQ